MEIQITKGILDTRANLVLYVDLEKRPSGTSSHLAEVYEETPQRKSWEQPKIFHSSGEGYTALSDALTFFDLLLELNDLPQSDLEMASWLFQCETGPAGTYKLRYQIREQVTYIQNHGEPELRPLNPSPENGSNVVSISNG
jgi:hypothetical protein